MATTGEQRRSGLGNERRRRAMAPVTREASGLPSTRRFLGPFWRTRGALVAVLAVWCAGLVGVGQAAAITEFPIPTASSFPQGIAAGPDGALWFTELNGNRIGRITTAGAITEFSIPTAHSRPIDIAAGPDGALWFTEGAANKIGRITTAGAITEFSLPTPGSQLEGIAAGPDGALWFTEQGGNKIGRITTAGAIIEFSIPTGSSFPHGITAGPDGALWFIEETANKIGRITTDTITSAVFVTRLYEQVLNREPDAAGLQAFVQRITQFGSVVPTVLAFFHSAEFLARNTDHAQFLAICYQTFLNRDPDPDGFSAFLTSLQLGQLTRDNLLDIFMDSQEFQAQASFLPPQDPLNAFVTTLYVRILGRGPDPAGLQGFVAEAHRACTTLPAVQTLLASPEFQARHTTNTEFVTLLYRVFLGRVPDAGGHTSFVTPLTQGTVTRDQLVAQFAASAEFQAVQQHLFPAGSCTPTVCLSVSVDAGGSVTVNPQGTNGGPNCGTAFALGTTVTLTAESDFLFFIKDDFLGWGGDCAAVGRRDSRTHGTCTLVMTTNKSVSAFFDCPICHTFF